MCPNVTNLGGTCDERCSSDDGCSNGQLCCSNGCGHACMDPVVDCAVSNGYSYSYICLIAIISYTCIILSYLVQDAMCRIYYIEAELLLYIT